MLCVFGALGGIIGATVLTSLKGKTLFVLINVYLLLIGALIIYRGLKDVAPRLFPKGFTRLIGFAGGLIEGIGGSWGPIVTTSLLGAGTESRYAIGSSNFSEFVVSVAVFSTFVAAFAMGYWDGGSDWHEVAWPVAGLVLGRTSCRCDGRLSVKNCAEAPTHRSGWIAGHQHWHLPLRNDVCFRLSAPA